MTRSGTGRAASRRRSSASRGASWPASGTAPALEPEQARRLDLEKRRGRLESAEGAGCDVGRTIAYASGDSRDDVFNVFASPVAAGYAAPLRTGPSASHGGLFQAGTRWRRLRICFQSPGCRQSTILAPITAWRRLPGSRGTWPLEILVCSATRWPPRTTSSRANQRTIRAHERVDETTPPGHGLADRGNRCGHGRPGQSWQATAVMAGHGGHGRPWPNVSDAGSRPRCHE